MTQLRPEWDEPQWFLRLKSLTHLPGDVSWSIPMPRTAKLFRNGRSQALRLPAEYRFEGSEVYIRRDPKTGDVILSKRPESWHEFFDLADKASIPDDFMAKRDDKPPQKRKLF